MAQLQIQQDIRPISDLKSGGSEIVTQVQTTHRPVVLTRHGRGVAVVLAAEDYDRLRRAANEGALLAALREGEEDIQAGRVSTQAEVEAKWLGEDEPRTSD